jgi:2-polyprenyl-6-methoxyphenol hydroxylase-like FAD-dependent oxidoreductase
MSRGGVHVNVAVIGGGPAGATAAGFLRKYAPEFSVAVFEREAFPREHVGESQLPPIGRILDELGAWPAIEAAGFPIKIGATYRWGNSDRLWDFEFVPPPDYRQEARPRSYGGQSKYLALQVERATYDDILLRHAGGLGASVHMRTPVVRVERSGDRVDALVLGDGRRVTADWYLDASGNAGTLRRAMDVGVEMPTRLQNVAFWDYWENTEWASRFPGGATRVLVLSIGCGWIWFIPLGATRTSIGFVCPARFYKEGDRSARELYDWALAQEPMIAALTARASREGEVRATRDWSFLADRCCGENWMLVGETAGFADPILAAGLTLTHAGAREAAHTVAALLRGEHDRQWLLHHYDDNQRTRIGQHIRFADFWYSANGVFTDLQEYTREIARDAGIDLDPQQAFQWLGTGGFTHDVLGQAVIGGSDLGSVRQIAQRMVDLGEDLWQLTRYNQFWLDLEDAERIDIPAYVEGSIRRVPCYLRRSKRLPCVGIFASVIQAVSRHCELPDLLRELTSQRGELNAASLSGDLFYQQIQVMELMLNDGWLRAAHTPRLPVLDLKTPREGKFIHSNVDIGVVAAPRTSAG